MGDEQTVELPLPRELVVPMVDAYRDRFAQVLLQAWGGYAAARSQARKQMAYAGPSARWMLVSDFTREPAHRIFADVPGVSVSDRFGRPWVHVDGGRVQVRFRKLTSALAICRSSSQRATRLAFHLQDAAFEDIPEGTILTAGYVLDGAELRIERLALVCHIGTQVHYVIPLPGGTATGAGATQLPLTPLSPPIIRSARAAVAKRLAEQAARRE